MNRLIAFFATKRLFGDMLTIFTIVIGIASTLLIRREVFPNVNFDIITIGTIFPGASPEEVEKLITNPIEQDLLEVDGIKKLRSVSTEGRSYIIAQLDPDQTTEEKGKSDIRDVIDQFTVPEGAEDSKVTAVQSKLGPIIEVSVGGDIPELELRRIAKDLEKQIEQIPGVARVVQRGLRDLEIRVEADPKLLARNRIALDDIVRVLRGQNIAIPGGTIDPPNLTDSERIVRTVGEFKTPADVEATVIRANDLGRPVLVRDVAQVRYDLERPTVINRVNGVQALSLTVLKKESGDAITLVDLLKAKIEELRPRMDSRVQISFANDFSSFIRRRLNVLSGNLLVGLCLVMIVLALILPIRVSLLVSLGIPFSFLGTMIIFNTYDYTLNLISMLGLIIVSGMLVDDAIVVTDNAVRLMEEGEDPQTAAIKGAQQIWPALVASVMTTMVAFLPMMFMTGIFGKFIKQIPLGVIIALLVSLVEAFFILPGHIASFIRVRAKELGKVARETPKGVLARTLSRTEAFWDHKVVPNYIRFLKLAIARRYIVLAGVGALFIGSISLAVFGMRFILFPPEGIEAFFVRGQAHNGASLEQTLERMRPLEKLIATLPKNELDTFITSIGIQQQDPNDPNTKRGSEYAQIAVYLTPETSRSRTAAQIIDDLRTRAGKGEGLQRLTFERVNPGPPVGRPVSLSVRADEYEQIMPAVAELKKLLAETPHVTDIGDSYIQGKEEIVIRVNKSEAAAAGLSVASVGTTVRSAFEGLIATSIQQIDEEVNVRVSLPQGSRESAKTLEQILIPNMAGNLIPLSSISKTESSRGISAYEHEGNRREVRVTADVNTQMTSAIAVNGELRKKLPEIQKKFPSVSVGFGGEDEDTQESMASLGRAFAVAAVGIFLILIFTFQNLLQPVLVLLTIPLGIIAVIWAFFVHAMPLSFMGMLGVIALAGVIVNNAIILVDFVNTNRIQGMDRYESIFAAAKMRVRPIVLTTLTTVSGLLPTAYGIGGLDKFVVPIAMALGWGLLFGSFLTAFVFPTAIAVTDDLSEWADRVRRRFFKPALSS